MKANVYDLNMVLSERQQWVVPVYQRHYEWEIGEGRQIRKIWEDIQDKALERLEQRTAYPHYFGAIIFSETEGQPFGTIRQRFLVDGQQRITTFHLVLTAIREVARSRGVSRFSDIVNAYLFNEKSASMQNPNRERFKLWPSSYDRNLYQNIIQSTPDELKTLMPEFFHWRKGTLKKGNVPKLLKAYYHLVDAISAFVQERTDELEKGDNTIEDTLDAILSGFLSGFQIVLIQLDKNDDAQEIFASLNGLGKPLSPFDLIRNDVFHRAQKRGEDNQKLFDEHWKIFEEEFWTEPVRQGRFKRARADHLMVHAVIAETAREVNIGKIASEYQRYAREKNFPTVAQELDVLITHADTYRTMEDLDDGGILSRISRIFRIWDMTTFHPLVLAMNAKKVDNRQKSKILKYLESYVVRREICGLTNKMYNKVAVGFVKRIQESENLLGAFKEHLANLSGDASRMPNNADLSKAFTHRQVYGYGYGYGYGYIPAHRLRFILEELEHKHQTKFDEAKILNGELMIGRVMPGKWAENWPLPDGKKAPCESSTEAIMKNYGINDGMKELMDAREHFVNTFGNLTLLPRVRSLSIGNAGWSVKKKEIRTSTLAINRYIASSDTWSEVEIEKRSMHLAKIARSIWPAI